MKNRNLIYFVFSLIVLSVSVGCTQQHRQTKLTRAYALVNANPDSVLHQLQAINYRQLPQDEKAYYALLYTMAQDKSGLDVDQDTLLHYAHDYYCTRLQDTMYAKCMYYVGCYYLLNDSNKLAEDCFQNAIRSAEENKDYYTQYLALNRLSHSLRENSPELALQSAKEAYHVYETHCNPNEYNKVSLLFGVSDIYLIIHETDSALSSIRQALEIAEKAENNELVSSSFQFMAAAYRRDGQKDSALYYAKKALEFSSSVSESLLLNLAECYVSVDSINESFPFLMKLRNSKHLDIQYRTYVLLRDNYYQLGKIQIGQQYADSATLVYNKRYANVVNERSQYLVDSLKLKSEKKKSQIDRLWPIIIFLFIIIVFFIIVNYNTKIHRKYTQKENNLINVLRQLQDERELREKDHVAFKEYLQKQEADFSDKQLRLMRRYFFAKFNLVPPYTHKSKEDLTPIHISEDDWIELTMFLNATANSFVERLTKEFPNLTEEDMRFFMLLKLDISLEALSRIYGLGPNSIKQKQNRYKAKVNLTDSNVSLRAFLRTY